MPFAFDNSYSGLPDAFFARIDPTPVSSPVMIRLNHDVASELGIDVARLDSPEGLAILSGNQLTVGSEPLAMAYSGHQFGGFSPQLGDGRAILRGGVVRQDICMKHKFRNLCALAALRATHSQEDESLAMLLRGKGKSR